jgi:hypothetical protein
MWQNGDKIYYIQSQKGLRGNILFRQLEEKSKYKNIYIYKYLI